MRPFLGILLGRLACVGVAASVWGAEPKVVSPRVIDEPVWSYPHKAQEAGVREGEAHALLSISEQGELLDFLVTGCTHLAFAEEVVKALPKYRFSPARVRGEPATVRLPLSFYFKQQGTIASFSTIDQWAEVTRLFPVTSQFVSFVCPGSQLDRPLTTTKVFTPRYPDELRSRRESGTVTIDFYVDGAGRVRLPAIDPGAHPSFAREAIAALGAWEFEPPRRAGQPVIVRAMQTFNFAPPDEPERKR